MGVSFGLSQRSVELALRCIVAVAAAADRPAVEVYSESSYADADADSAMTL